jgi:hypothetical protein
VFDDPVSKNAMPTDPNKDFNDRGTPEYENETVRSIRQVNW